VLARLPSLLIDREVGRRGERQRDAAQPKAACAIGLEACLASAG
jgi:hypothetical protein